MVTQFFTEVPSKLGAERSFFNKMTGITGYSHAKLKINFDRHAVDKNQLKMDHTPK